MPHAHTCIVIGRDFERGYLRIVNYLINASGVFPLTRRRRELDNEDFVLGKIWNS